MAELDVYIKEVYGEAVSACEICQKLCLQVSYCYWVFGLDSGNCFVVNIPSKNSKSCQGLY